MKFSYQEIKQTYLEVQRLLGDKVNLINKVTNLLRFSDKLSTKPNLKETMKNIIILFLISFSLNAQEFSERFKPNENVYLFGNNVRLREKPSTTSNIVNKLNIGSKITIIEKTNKTKYYNNILWNWYKVKTDKEIGFILGGLLSKNTVIGKNNSMYLFSCKKETTKNNYFFLIRNLKNDKIIEYKMPFKPDLFFGLFDICNWTKIYFDSSIPNVEEVIFIGKPSHDEGDDEGALYLFNNGKKIIKAIETIDEGWEDYHYFEKVILPSEENGNKENLIKIEITYKYFDYKTHKNKIIKKEILTEWKEKEIIIPKIKVNR